MIDAIDKKEMCYSVITGKENTSKEWNCIIAMVLTSFNVYFVFVYAYFMCSLYAAKLLSGLFWLFLGQSLAFLVKIGWQPCSAATGKVGDMSELQAHHCMTPEQRT